jgi:hypothetical protein
MRMMARTAVVAGTATAVSGRVARRQNARWADQEAQAAPPAAAPPASGTDDKLDQLKQLGELHTAGVLTDAEFEAQKAKILAG